MAKAYTIPVSKDELTAYYNDVEESIIHIFGSFEKAAEWFEEHPIALNNLFAYCEEKYVDGWSANRAANNWYHVKVADLPITKYPSPILPAPATTSTASTASRMIYYQKPDIEPEIRAARVARVEAWNNAHLVDRT